MFRMLRQNPKDGFHAEGAGPTLRQYKTEQEVRGLVKVS